MYEAQEVNGASVKAGRGAPEVLELVEASLHGVSDLVGFEIIGDPPLSCRVTGDHRLSLHGRDQITQSIGIIRLVRKNALRRQAIQQVRRNRRVATLAQCQDYAQGSAEGICGQMYLCRQTTSGSPQSLVPPFEPLPVAAC